MTTKTSTTPKYAILFIAGLMGGYEFQLIGIVFACDIMFLAIAVVGLGTFWRSAAGSGTRNTAVLLLSFPFVAVGVDGFNSVPLSDMARGGARNVVFVATVVSAVYIWKIFGWRRFCWFNVAVLFSRTLFGYGNEATAALVGASAEVTTDLAYIVKYLNAQILIFPVLFLLGRWPMIVFFALVVVGVADVVLLDARSGGVIFGLIAVLYLWRNSRANSGSAIKWAIGISIAIALVGYIVGKNFDIDDARFLERWEGSNSERFDMAYEAWKTILANPITGVGSWQLTNGYFVGGATRDQAILGVHSGALMLMSEYGIWGTLVTSAMLLLMARSVRRVVSVKGWNPTELRDMMPFIIQSLVVAVYILSNCPFNGFVRIIFGFNVGCAFVVLDDFRSRSPANRTDRAVSMPVLKPSAPSAPSA